MGDSEYGARGRAGVVLEAGIDRELPGPAGRIVAETALGRLGAGEDVAEVVAFLASPAARWITGQVVDASGGLHLGVG